MDYAPIARIILRYILGAAFMGSDEIGMQFATDPDLVMFGTVIIGAVVEGLYAFAKKKGWAT